ncbi:MAG TPA: hypothetical protein VKB65_02450 [Myxococcota bacterium]|nr:hypothetical protein [Myxococcota bacterium]
MRQELHDFSPGAHGPLRAVRLGLALALLGGLALALGGGSARANGGGANICKKTSTTLLSACKKEVFDDFLTAKAICLNETDPDDAAECRSDAVDELNEAWPGCFEVREARDEACDLLGPGAYDPDFDPESFVDPVVGNPFQPLQVGNHWEYEGDGESIVIDVLDETKQIEGVTCVTVRDQASEDGVLVENTDDWIAEHANGDTWYCGEISQGLETFDGDDPEEPELVTLEGSWKAGRDGAKPGILIPADAPVGATYRQEFLPGDAEDMAMVLSRTWSYGNGEGLDGLVPQDLADLLCDGDCMVTREFSALDPGLYELKYYSPGVGLFLEVAPDAGEIVPLVACNVDPRCAALP